jgi:flagellar hook-associated protein 1 FlgK
MGGLLSVGTRALQANQVALQTAGNNIANVNTPGYSRQSVVVQTVQGQYTGGGYIGKGVEVLTIKRELSTFLTTQSTLAGSVQSGDAARADKLGQLADIFEGGANGLGAAISDMVNAFSDVANAPTDLTARNVVLTRVDETAKRMNASAGLIDELAQSVVLELKDMAKTVNTLAQGIADVNGQIAGAMGSGQTPNDLLDKREQLIRELNQYVQTTSISADDGTTSVFLGGSQALVLGTTAATVSVNPGEDEFQDPFKSKLTISRLGQKTTLNENTLGGGELSGLLRFQNNDLAEGRNLLGRMTVAITSAINNQHALGLDMDGNQGTALFTSVMLPDARAANGNLGTVSRLAIAVFDPTKLAVTDYQVSYSGPTAGTVTRLSDNNTFAFGAATTYPTANDFFNNEGLDITLTGTPVAGDRFLLQPLSTAALNVSREFSSPRALAVASRIAGSVSTSNTGSLSLSKLQALSNDTNLAATVTLTFNGAGAFDVVGTGTGNPLGVAYTSGQAITYNGWSLTLQGTPKAGDAFTVTAQPAANRNLNAVNANAMWDLGNKTMFDEAAMTDGYAGLMSQIGVRSQSANYAADVSSTIASNLEKDRTSVAGVNLDEEAAKLLQYQQAYQASAKMIQIAQSIFDTLIQTLSR